jgi:CO/xanthine dehydrogenase Mo-binding subunit
MSSCGKMRGRHAFTSHKLEHKSPKRKCAVGAPAEISAHDVPRNEQRMELPGRMAEATAGAVLATQPVLADDRVRFQGEPVVAIAATTPEIAAAAAELRTR